MTYGKLNVKTYGNEEEKLFIGSYCSIAGEVKFLLGGEHPYKTLSTYPFRRYVLKEKENTISKGPIIVKDDVWIGERVIILSGVEIGQGAVIAAGSVVSKNIPPYAIFAGYEIKKYRFSEKIIKKLVLFNFEQLAEKLIVKNIENLYRDINEMSIDKELERLNVD